MKKVHTLSDNDFQVQINSVGAEICSFKSLKTGTEYIWQADPAIWGSSAPVLFPIIGCLKENHFLVEGQRYTVPKHGFIRGNSALGIVEISESCVEFRLTYDENSLNNYPFKFDFCVRFKLQNNTFIVSHYVTNLDSEKPLYFSLGGHPAFACPFEKESNYEDHYLEFEHPETLNRWEVLENGLIGTTETPFLSNQQTIPLSHDLFANDALIFKNPVSKKIALKSKQSNKSITVSYSDFSYLGIWAKPAGDFVCIEPWLGISDSNETNQQFLEKEGIICLDALQTIQKEFTIEINE